MELIFVNTTQCSRGKGASVRLISKESVVYGNAQNLTRATQVGTLDSGRTVAVPSLTVEEFETYFTESDILIMQNNGVLDYFPDGCKGEHSKYIFTDNATKYPIFSAKVYKKYGRAVTPGYTVKQEV